MNEPLIEIIRPGLFTTVQDLGRSTGEDLGVPCGGAMDPRSLQAANILAGNPRSAACLEINLTGPVLRFLGDCRVAVCGAEFELFLDGQRIEANCGWNARSWQTLSFGRCLRGARAYVAISGGIDVPMVFGGRSTYTPARIGGLDGRRLREGDRLCGTGMARPLPDHRIATSLGFMPMPPVSLRCLRGPQIHWFASSTQDLFWTSAFAVSTRADRTGARLDGPALVRGEDQQGDMISEPTPLGTVQVSPDGAPTVLMADRPTIGGYPKIATVIGADLPALAQSRPGDTVHFVESTLEEAHAAGREVEKELRILQMAFANFRCV